jgi:hypothetical protein
MRPLSATECIQPAIDRTKLMLFSPFRKGRTWKLCATSYACRFGSMYFPTPLLFLAFIPELRRSGAVVILFTAIGATTVLALFTWVFHLCSRLQFAYFDMVANRGEFVAPAWHKYRDHAWPWTGFKIVTGTAATAVLAIPSAVFVRRVLPVFAQMTPQQPGQISPQFAHAMTAFYAGYGVLMLGIFAGMLLFGLLSDFVLPSLALERTTILEGFRRMGRLIQQEPGEFAIYVLLKTALGGVAYFAALIAWEVAFVIATLIVGGVVFVAGFALHAAGIPTVLLVAVGVTLAIIWYIFAFFYIMILGVGAVMTWMDAYAVYFLGGRYPMLGDMLDESTPAPFPIVLDPYLQGYPPPLPPTA